MKTYYINIVIIFLEYQVTGKKISYCCLINLNVFPICVKRPFFYEELADFIIIKYKDCYGKLFVSFCSLS